MRRWRSHELTVQGVKRSDQNALLDAFLEQTAHADLELETSVLSGIDMTLSGPATPVPLTSPSIGSFAPSAPSSRTATPAPEESQQFWRLRPGSRFFGPSR